MSSNKVSHMLVGYLMNIIFYLGLITAFISGGALVYLIGTSGLQGSKRILGIDIDFGICKGIMLVLIILQLLIWVIRFFESVRGARPTGVLLAPGVLPAVNTLVRQVAMDLQVNVPDEVYIQPIPQAAAYETPSRLGSRRTLFLGWPLILSLSQAELKAIVGHELAHFDNDAFILHRALWHIEGAMQRTSQVIRRIEDSNYAAMKGTLTVYLFLFTLIYMPITRAIRYKFELYCDERAASCYGANVFGNALRKTVMLLLSLGSYIKQGVDRSGPGFFRGYLNYHSQLLQEGKLDSVVMQIADVSDKDHPSLSKRLEAIAYLSTQYDNGKPIEVGYAEKSEIEKQLVAYL